MAPIVRWLFGIAAAAVFAGQGVAFPSGTSAEEVREDGPEVITRDVCIIGGGSSGTYAAIRLQDEGKSVMVIEKDSQLGGHTSTYVDPETGTPVDYGVVVFHDLDLVKDYFNRLGVKHHTATLRVPGNTYHANMQSGELFPKYAPPNPMTSFQTYGQQLARYPGLEKGFNFPTPIPEDLILPFGEFVEKYNISDAVPTIAMFAHGLGTLREQTTLYVMKNFGLGVLQNMQSGFLAATSNNNHEIYDKALEILQPNVLTESHVVSMSRNSSDGVTVTVDSPSGQKIIQASKLLVAIPPKLDNLDGFDLDETESSLFGQFLNTGYYTSLITNTGFPNGVSSVENMDPTKPYNLPSLPGIYDVTGSRIPGLYSVKYGSPTGIPDEDVKADIISSLKRLQLTGFSEKAEPEFVRFSSHAPFELTVPVEAIKSGFYEDLYGLQGHRNTFYTGAAFHTQDSSLLWQFTEDLLPQLGVGNGES
ncbi:hypothetical protein FQN54_001480 [Arachnomyces sp. PD_36]|nr:hypothetical protein FQN54_001480 [Arachnomyces sp. PD_36]